MFINRKTRRVTEEGYSIPQTHEVQCLGFKTIIHKGFTPDFCSRLAGAERGTSAISSVVLQKLAIALLG